MGSLTSKKRGSTGQTLRKSCLMLICLTQLDCFRAGYQDYPCWLLDSQCTCLSQTWFAICLQISEENQTHKSQVFKKLRLLLDLPGFCLILCNLTMGCAHCHFIPWCNFIPQTCAACAMEKQLAVLFVLNIQCAWFWMNYRLVNQRNYGTSPFLRTVNQRTK
jgi:hypothetical protein